jgi:tryptophan synthase alpha chain
VKTLETKLRGVRESGRKALVTYFMGGLTPDWTRHVEAAVLAGADAVEIGLPFSDPMMDGPVVQEAALRALEAGTTFDSISSDLEHVNLGVPLIAMTYYNIFLHHGLERAAGQLANSGISGAIVPDLSLEETSDWHSACDNVDVATILLVAPSTPSDRVARLARASEGFLYASARMAVTGRSEGEGQGARVVQSIRDVSDIPAFIGIGIGSPEQAHDAANASDGAIVGSALVQIILDGGGLHEIEQFIGAFRTAIDS